MSAAEWALLIGAAAAYAGGVASTGPRALRLGRIGCLLQALLFGLRWRAAGHLPLMGSWETALGGSWALAASALVVEARHGTGILRPALSLVLALLALGLAHPTPPVALTISETNPWVDLHTVLAWGALAAYGLAAASALRTVLEAPRTIGGGDGRNHAFFYARLGFVLQSAMMASGAYYELTLFARWWRWDPVESLSLASWIVWGIVLHLRLFNRWDPVRWGRAALLAFALFLVSYKLVPELPAGSTFHQFDLKFGK